MTQPRPIKVDLVNLIAQAAPQVYGSEERDMLEAWLSRNTEDQEATVYLERAKIDCPECGAEIDVLPEEACPECKNKIPAKEMAEVIAEYGRGTSIHQALAMWKSELGNKPSDARRIGAKYAERLGLPSLSSLLLAAEEIAQAGIEGTDFLLVPVVYAAQAEAIERLRVITGDESLTFPGYPPGILKHDKPVLERGLLPDLDRA